VENLGENLNTPKPGDLVMARKLILGWAAPLIRRPSSIAIKSGMMAVIVRSQSKGQRTHVSLLINGRLYDYGCDTVSWDSNWLSL
jgi:hypothetical protein